MSFKKTVQVIFFIAIAGVLFSGYLSYKELFVEEGCGRGALSCGRASDVGPLPACVYGFVMYLIVLILSGLSLLKNKSKE
jgi:hypothetical protein